MYVRKEKKNSGKIGMTKTVFFYLSSILTSKKKIIHSYIDFIRKYTNDSCIDLTWGTEAV